MMIGRRSFLSIELRNTELMGVCHMRKPVRPIMVIESIRFALHRSRGFLGDSDATSTSPISHQQGEK